MYNLTDGERSSKRRFIETLGDGLGIARPTRSVPLWPARVAALPDGGGVRAALATRQPPTLTQARLKFLGLNLDFSCEQAKSELGYAPRVAFDEAMATTVASARSRKREHEGATRGDRG